MSAMSKPRESALEAIQKLPEDATYEDILYELSFRAAVEEGLAQAAEGRSISRSEFTREALEWLKSASPRAHD